MKSIRHNLLAFALLATLLPSLGLGLLSFLRYQDLVNEAARRELHALAKEADDEVRLWRRERAHEIRTLASAYTVIDALGADGARPGATPVGPDGLALYLRAVARKLDLILELTVLDARGQPVASNVAAPAAVAPPDRWSDAALVEGALVVPPHWDAARATATLAVAFPVLSARNEVLGTLAAVLDLASVAPRLRGVVGPLPAEVVLLAADGTPLVSTQGPATALTPLAPTVLADLRSHTDEPLAFTGLRGREVLGIAAAPGPVPVVVVAERERAEIFSAWLELVQVYVVIVVALMLVVGAVAYAMGRAIVAPLAALTDAAERIARGDLDVTLRDDAKDELGRLTRVFDGMAARLRESQHELEQANERLRAQKAELETLAATDSLTGLANRKRLDAFLAEEFARFAIHRRPFALAMIELDNLAAITADFGLATGDDVLVTFAAMLRQSVRPVDLVARFGGETFVAVLIDTPFDEAVAVAEHIRAQADASAIGVGPQPITVAVSIGVAQSRDGDPGPDAVLFRADHALHEARRAGGGRVQSAM